MKLLLTSVVSLFLLSSCAYQSGVLEKETSAPTATDIQQTIEAPAQAPVAPENSQLTPNAVAAKMISPVR